MQGIVETMVAELACSRAAHKQARQAADTRVSITMAEEATAMIERTLDKGRHVGINEVAERLYTSRSKLCATFKAQTASPWAPTFADAVWSERRTFWQIARSR